MMPAIPTDVARLKRLPNQACGGFLMDMMAVFEYVGLAIVIFVAIGTILSGFLSGEDRRSRRYPAAWVSFSAWPPPA